jgi:O-antigen ligase
VGIIASLYSPKATVALYWAAAYLAVPLVLWAILGGNNPLDQLRRIINANWVLVILLVAALFVVAVMYLGLGSVILDPSSWLECGLKKPWLSVTHEVVRSTGVGRYAAIGGILATAGLWQGNWRFPWVVILLASLLLLLTSGARGALGGFAAGLVVVGLLYGGKRAAVLGVIAGLSLAPVIWFTGPGQQFLDRCIFRTGISAESAPQLGESNPQLLSRIPDNFFELTGRTRVWKQGLQLFRQSPVLGYGFHADRLLLNTHMHNALMQALVQTGLMGAIPFMAALLFAWFLLFNLVRDLASLPLVHKHLIIQSGGVLAFLSVRAIPESTGAFFGVDWLLLAPLLIYLQVAKHSFSGSGMVSKGI